MGNLREVGNKADVDGDIKKFFGCKLPPIEELQRPWKKAQDSPDGLSIYMLYFGNGWL